MSRIKAFFDALRALFCRVRYRDPTKAELEANRRAHLELGDRIMARTEKRSDHR